MSLEFLKASSQGAELDTSLTKVHPDNQGTIIAVVKIPSAYSPPNLTIFGLFDKASTFTRFEFAISGFAGSPVPLIFITGGFTNVQSFATNAIPLNAIAHLAVAASGVGNGFDFYVNGLVVASTDNSGAPGTWMGRPALLDRITIGQRHLGGTSADFFYNDAVHEIKTFDQVLTAQEIFADFLSPIGSLPISRGLKSHYILNAGLEGVAASGAGTIKDIGPRRFNLTPVNSPIYRTSEVSQILRQDINNDDRVVQTEAFVTTGGSNTPPYDTEAKAATDFNRVLNHLRYNSLSTVDLQVGAGDFSAIGYNGPAPIGNLEIQPLTPGTQPILPELLFTSGQDGLINIHGDRSNTTEFAGGGNIIITGVKESHIIKDVEFQSGFKPQIIY